HRKPIQVIPTPISASQKIGPPLSKGRWSRVRFGLRFRLDHQLDDFFGDVGLEAFGVALVDTGDVGDDAAVLARRIFSYVGWARTRSEAPDSGCVLAVAGRVVDIARLRIAELARFGRLGTAAEFLRPFRLLRHALVGPLVIAGFVDEGERLLRQD